MSRHDIPDDLLRLLAEDARTVILWAMKQGMKKDQQVEQTAKALKKRFEDSQIEPDVADPTTVDARLDLGGVPA